MICKCPIAIYKTGLVLTYSICASIVNPTNPLPPKKLLESNNNLLTIHDFVFGLYMLLIVLLQESLQMKE